MKYIDKLLNTLTMYRVVLYGLMLIAVVAIELGFAGSLAFSGLSLIASLAIILLASWSSNKLFARLFHAPANVESVYITAFILFFLLEPLITVNGVIILISASLIATLSKYIFAIGKKHIFNPIVITAVILALAGNGSVIWWVATPVLSGLTLVVGLLIVRKIRRFPMFLAFILTSIFALTITYVIPYDVNPLTFLNELFLSWPIVFFATIMFTEPLTTPPTKSTQIVYAIVVGMFFASRFHIGPLSSTPQLALLIGNIYSYLVSSKQKLILRLKTETRISENNYDFAFEANQKLKFIPGQYLEWTLAHKEPDGRGNRRYFTVASSPTEDLIHLGVRIDPKDSSSFKKALLSMEVGDEMVASHLSGEFTMPKNPAKKLVFIAGGIGITPFRSMIKYLIDVGEKRDVTLFYCANSDADFSYHELFEEARTKIGLQIIFIPSAPSETWQGLSGRITPEIIVEIVPDFYERYFMLSGPNAMVENYKKLLHTMGVKKSNIKTDYFPGF